MLRIIPENKQKHKKYTYEELVSLKNIGGSVTGKVIKCTTDNYLIVELGDNITGELHITDFEDSSKETPKVALVSKVGKPIEAIVDEVYGDKVILNRAKLQKEYKEEVLNKELTPGDVLDTVVYSTAPFGVFVELGKGVLALLPIDLISVSRLTYLNDVFPVGSAIKVVFKNNNDGMYVVTHRELLGTWEENLAEFEEGEVVQGVIRSIKSYGAFVEISPNLTGLAQLPDFPIVVGDSVTVLLKQSEPEFMKLKLHIIETTEIPYGVKYNYKITEGNIKEWKYNPISDVTSKIIETIF